MNFKAILLPVFMAFINVMFCQTGLSIMNYYTTEQLGFLPEQIDSNRRLYNDLKVTEQVDSAFVNNTLDAVGYAKYDHLGRLISFKQVNFNVPKETILRVWQYNDSNRICYQSTAIIHGMDTIDRRELRLLEYDTKKGIKSFELIKSQPGLIPRTYKQDKALMLYADSKCIELWNGPVVPRTVFYLSGDSVLHSKINFIGLNGPDTLFNVHIVDSNGVTWVQTQAFINEYSSEAIEFYTPGYLKLYSTKTWEFGNLIESHVYKDSVGANGRICKWNAFDMLKDSVNPEFVVTLSDTINVVRKNGVNVLVEYIHEDNKEPPPDFEKFYADLSDYPYSTTTSLANNRKVIKYFDFSRGTIRPLFQVWYEGDGVIYRIEDDEQIVIRHVIRK